MAKVELKTRQTEASVDDFLARIANEEQREDCRTIVGMMGRISGEEAKMWGPAIIGFGTTPLKYASGRELDWPKIAFSPRKNATTLYLSCSANDFAPELEKLGKYKAGKGCIYIKRLADVDAKVLERMIKKALGKKK
jgi:hypothetical protein